MRSCVHVFSSKSCRTHSAVVKGKEDDPFVSSQLELTSHRAIRTGLRSGTCRIFSHLSQALGWNGHGTWKGRCWKQTSPFSLVCLQLLVGHSHNSEITPLRPPSFHQSPLTHHHPMVLNAALSGAVNWFIRFADPHLN